MVNVFLFLFASVDDDVKPTVATPPVAERERSASPVTTPSSPSVKPPTLDWEGRVKAACAVVAVDFGCAAQAALGAINARVIYSFHEKTNADLVEIIREVIARRNEIFKHVEILANELSEDRNSVLLSLDDEWCRIYEAAETSNRDLLETMREAYLNYKKEKQEAQDSNKPVRAKSKAPTSMELERLGRFKPTTDGNRTREKRIEDNERKAREAREEKVKKARASSNN